MAMKDRETPSLMLLPPPHPAHVRNNRILIEYKQSGERQQEKVAHGNMEEALCKPPIQSSCRSVRVSPSSLACSSSSSLFHRTSLYTILYPWFFTKDLRCSTDITTLYPVLSLCTCKRMHVPVCVCVCLYIRARLSTAPDVANIHPDWRFSYLIVDCHAKARTSYWLGVGGEGPSTLSTYSSSSACACIFPSWTTEEIYVCRESRVRAQLCRVHRIARGGKGWEECRDKFRDRSNGDTVSMLLTFAFRLSIQTFVPPIYLSTCSSLSVSMLSGFLLSLFFLPSFWKGGMGEEEESWGTTPILRDDHFNRRLEFVRMKPSQSYHKLPPSSWK